MCPLSYLPFLLIKILLFELNQSLLSKFLIVVLVFDAKILKGFFSPHKLFKKLLLVSIRINMSK